MSELRPGLPDPVPTALSEGFWKGAAEGRLLLQRCLDCGAHRYSPAPACYRCQKLCWEWSQVSGRGRVYSYTWSHHPVHPGLRALGTYNVSVIELHGTEGDPVRILSFVTGVSPETLRVGLEVELHFDRVSEGIALPVFRPVEERTAPAPGAR
jgi:uncharacterized OB-fold protein